MFPELRRLVRRFLPRRADPWLDPPVVDQPLDSPYANAYASALTLEERADAFASARFEEGRRWRGVLDRAAVGTGPVLDLGAGSGAVALANAAGGRRFVTLDFLWNETARIAHERAGAPFRHVIGDAAHLPFRDGAFEAIVSLETVEHLPDVIAAGRETSRVLRDGGCIVMTTPPRLRWLLRGDPHFGIRFLLLFPPRIQRSIAARRGFDQPHHYVDRIYASVPQLARLFPRCRIERIMNRTRLPGRWFFDAVLLRKR
ncbi:MAG TPA: class I SAM-dependent methyltransferase [Thermoanaerobaculia bacterium]|nr:class I SAM-dependent methyltransferase [Thermoanaerobaculia bacterium]